jgi:hypothetical protein
MNFASQIISNTPLWVYPLLTGLIILGLIQTRDRSMGWLRVVMIPFGFSIFSIYGVLSAFGLQLNTMLLWLLGIFIGIGIGVAFGVTTQASSKSNEIIVKGSWIPMILILGIFITKYSVGVAIALKVAALQTEQSAMVISLLYGIFSGVFVGRAALIFRLIGRNPAAAST